MWRTPAAHEPGVSAERLVPIEGGEPGGMNRHFDKHTGRMAQIGLPQQVAMREKWSTPTVNDAKNSLTDSQRGRGTLTANMVERLWPTPTLSGNYNRKGLSQKSGDGLETAVKFWPRTAGMCGGTGNWNQLKIKCEDITEARKMGAGNGGQLNPDWVEWLMGYPIGWTDLEAESSRNPLPFDPEPAIPRVATGRKNRVARLKCLGNSIVPEIAWLIFRQIKEMI